MSLVVFICVIIFFNQKPAYEMRISDWSSDVCSSDLQSESGLANATTGNLATSGGSAGNDSIVADGGASGDDVVAGDAQALSQSGHALSESVNGLSSTVGSVGNDDIWTGGFNQTGDLVAGDPMAKSGGTATAHGDNLAWNANTAGVDTLVSGAGHDTITCGAMATQGASSEGKE